MDAHALWPLFDGLDEHDAFDAVGLVHDEDLVRPSARAATGGDDRRRAREECALDECARWDDDDD